MIRLVAGHSAQVATWVANQIPFVSEFGPCEGIAVMRDEYMIAGVVYHDYQPEYESIQISMAAISPMWARPATIARLLQYPFEQLKVYRVWAAVPLDNERALATNTHIGFRREGVLSSMFGKGRHGVVMRMLEPDYKRLYARFTDGQIQT